MRIPKDSLLEYDYLKVKYRQELGTKRAKLNQKYRKRRKYGFRILTFCVAMIIFFNVGAIFLTNMLVFRANPGTVLHETNPVQCEINDFSCAGGGWPVLLSFVKQAIFYAFMIWAYGVATRVVVRDRDYYFLAGVVIFYLVLMGMDFFNDFGFYIGKILWGLVL